MLKFLRKHDKKFVAVGMVILMISFLASGNGRSNRTGSQIVIGTLNGKPVYANEKMMAVQEWQTLNKYVRITNKNTGETAPITATAQFLGPVFRAINDQPELFMLLRHEARTAGVRIQNDELETILVNYYQRPEGEDAEAVDDVVREGLTDLLMIRANFDRIAGNVKISDPLVRQRLAEVVQKIQLNVIELTAADFLSKAPAPTTQAVQEQFNKYAGVDPDRADPRTNPFRFGYRLPDRVKLQFVKIDRAEVEKSVVAMHTPYDWDVQARLYYLQHKEQFAAAPASQPSSQPSVAAASSQPVIQPYEQVREEALRKVRDPMIDHLQLEIQGRILAVINSDRQSLTQNSSATTAPTTAQSASTFYDHIKQAADSMQTQFGVKVYVTDLGRDYLSAKDLATLPEIGDATADRTAFVDVAMQQAAVYYARADKGTPAAQGQLMQASPPLTDALGNSYIFRLTDVQPTEPAPNLASVASRIDLDLRKQAAFGMAHDLATGLISAAGTTSLSSAAMSAGRTVKTTDPFSLDSRDFGSSITLSPLGQASFREQAFFGSLSQYKPDSKPHPLQLIEVPPDFKVYVAQLASLTSTLDASSLQQAMLVARQQLWQSYEQNLWQQWLNADAVIARMGYKPMVDKS